MSERIVAARTAALAIVCAVLCIGCGPQSAASPGSLGPTATAGCFFDADAASSIDGVFAELPGFTVEPVCPADMDPYFDRPEVTRQYFEVAAGRVTQDGLPVLAFMAAQLNSGDGEAFVRDYVSAWYDEYDPPKTVTGRIEELGGHQVQRFNVPIGPRGYIYVDGPTVVIAYVDWDAAPALADDAFIKILANLH